CRLIGKFRVNDEVDRIAQRVDLGVDRHFEVAGMRYGGKREQPLADSLDVLPPLGAEEYNVPDQFRLLESGGALLGSRGGARQCIWRVPDSSSRTPASAPLDNRESVI